MINLGDAVLSIGGDASLLYSTLDDVNTSLTTKLQVSATVVGEMFSQIGNSIMGAFDSAINQSVEYASSVVDMAAKTQTSTQAFSELQYAVEQSGGTAENLSKSLINISKGLFDAQNATGPFYEALNILGINIDSLKGKSPDQIFVLLAESISQIQDPILQSNMAIDLFGLKVGPELLPLLQQGANGIGQLRKEAQDLGISLSTEQANQLESFGDSFANIEKSMTGVYIQLATALMPILQKFVTETVIPTITELSKWIKANPELTQTILQSTIAVGGLLAVLGPVLVVLPGIVTSVNLLGTAFSSLLGGVGLLTATGGIPALALAVTVLVGAFSTFTIYKFIESLYQLKEANDELIKSSEQLEATQERYNQTIGKQKQESEDLLITWLNHYSNLSYTEEQYAQAKNLMLNQLLTEEQAAQIAISDMNTLTKTMLMQADQETTASILNSLGMKLEYVYSTDGKIVESAWETADQQKQAADYAITSWGDFWEWLDSQAAKGVDVYGNPLPPGEVPAFASGGIAPGGLALVGERGPELVNLPAGSRVFNNNDTQKMLSGNSNVYSPTINVTVNNANNLNANDIAKQIEKVLRK